MRQSDASKPVDRAVTPLDLMRERLRLWNTRFHDLATDLQRIDSQLADAISDHLDAIGLDDINHQSNEQHGHWTGHR